MTPSGGTSRKRYLLFSLAVLLILAGGAALFLELQNFLIRSVGLVALIGGVQLVRMSRVHASDQPMTFATSKGPGRLVWFVGIALLLLCGLCCFFMYIDAVHGYHTGWPVYMFAGVGLACTVVWCYIIAKLNA
jgi:hypothetical protein